MTDSLFERLAAEENKFFDSEFLSPVIKGQPVRVRVAGVIVSLNIRPKKFEGWGIFKCVDDRTAKFVKEPTLAQKQQYFNLYPRLSLVIVAQGENTLGTPANNSDPRIKISGWVPVSLPEEIRLFDTVDVRWDGVNFWYECHSNYRSPRFADKLRDAMQDSILADKLTSYCSGLTAEERAAYAAAVALNEEFTKNVKENLLRDALQRAGASLKSFVERGNTYTVEYVVGNETHHSVVDRDTLQVRSAGICLSGRDKDFDLQSLVGVVREGQDTHRIYRVGLGDDVVENLRITHQGYGDDYDDEDYY